ncbi:MAG: glycosyltransferase [Planctomycetota bacterium]
MSQQSHRIALASGCDDNYVMPLAVMLRSALDHLSADHGIDFFLLDGGISSASMSKLVRSVDDPRISIHVIPVDLSRFSDLPADGHVTSAAYCRLLLPSLLPENIGRIIYADCDMLVCRDLSELNAVPFNDHAALAVQDAAAPFIDASIVREVTGREFGTLAADRPIANYQSLGLDPSSAYFNSGLMVIDVDVWRTVWM